MEYCRVRVPNSSALADQMNGMKPVPRAGSGLQTSPVPQTCALCTARALTDLACCMQRVGPCLDPWAAPLAGC